MAHALLQDLWFHHADDVALDTITITPRRVTLHATTTSSFMRRGGRVCAGGRSRHGRTSAASATAFREDASKVGTGHGPENMATLRSFAIDQLRAAGHTNIAAALREMSLRPFERPLTLLGAQPTSTDPRSSDFAIALPSDPLV